MATTALDKLDFKPSFSVDEGDYFTDGSRLYYIIKCEEDCVHVENCETLFTARVAYDTIELCWAKLDFTETRQRKLGVYK